jgi:hypothetical protein
MRTKTVIFIILNLLLTLTIFGQTQPTLEEILNQAEQQTANYQETFRNLLAAETKTFIDFDKNGQEKSRNTVEADFLVYQSSKNNKVSFELRNVKNVDGKPIPNSQENSDSFFAELNKASTLRSELEKIQKSSSKYDKTLDVSGLTLYEGIIFSQNLRPYFEYKLDGRENYQGQDVFVISYWQTKQSPFISINGKRTDPNNPSLEFDVDIPGGIKKEEVFLRGKFWVDANTYQIWREEREVVGQGSELAVLLKTDFDYQASNYGILVPKQIILLFNQVRKKDGKYTAVKDLQIIFDYTNFRRTETDVKILDDAE